MIFSIFLLVIIITLLGIKIYKTKHEFFTDTPLYGFEDINAEEYPLSPTETCRAVCDNTDTDCTAVQQKDSTTCLISKNKINSSSLKLTDLKTPLYIKRCPPLTTTQPELPKCNDIEKDRRRRINEMCDNKPFNVTTCNVLKEVCEQRLPACP